MAIPGAIVIIVVAAAALYYENGGDAPPVMGAVQNFIVATEAETVPAVSVIDADGGSVAFERYRGKLIVLNFWATWCSPCIRELPSLERLSALLPADKARVVLLSQDRGGFDQVTPFLANLKIDIADSYVDERLGFSRAAAVQSLPTTILFGPDGVELGRLTGVAEWDSPEALALIRYYLK